MCDTCFESVTTECIIMFLGGWPETGWYSYRRRLPRAQKRLNVSSVIYIHFFFLLLYSVVRSNIQSKHHRCWNDRNTLAKLLVHYAEAYRVMVNNVYTQIVSFFLFILEALSYFRIKLLLKYLSGRNFVFIFRI